jgi:hypothetical protein
MNVTSCTSRQPFREYLYRINLAFASRSVNRLPVGAEGRDEIPIKLHDSSISVHLNIGFSGDLKAIAS